uniref:CB1 cannabinoid receptor-interacting protein 1 n=1 Tax=Hydra vulgaris TaxID=6087 RepID=T2M7W6_HYDVU
MPLFQAAIVARIFHKDITKPKDQTGLHKKNIQNHNLYNDTTNTFDEKKLKKRPNARKTSECEKKSLQSCGSSSNKSSINSGGNDLKLKISFYLANMPGNGPGSTDVFFKQDGQRFNEQHTIKLATCSNYQVKMEIEPMTELTFFKLGGMDIKFEKVTNTANDTKLVYQLFWSTAGISTTMRKFRTDVPCTIKFKKYKKINFKFQVKFYSSNDRKRSELGKKLNSIDLECTIGRGSYTSSVDCKTFN